MPDYQGSYNGLAFGAGTDVQLVSIDGLRALPEIRSGDVPRSRQDGSWAGLNFLGERIFTALFEVFAPSQPFETVVAGVATALQNISDPNLQLPFDFQVPGWAEPRRVICRPTKGGTPINVPYVFHRAQIPVEFTANDPLVYSSTLRQASAGLPSPTAGLTFPVTFPVTFGASTGGSMSVTNAGNYITAPVITITGPVTNPTVTFVASGQFMTVNITLGPSDVLVIDMANRSVMLNGTASRYNLVTTGSQFWGIPPGTWSIGVASTDSSPVAALFTVTWRDAWGWA
ncbi:MAG: hypothetical protein AB7T06_24750 [Kofleriaceae bacterium]